MIQVLYFLLVIFLIFLWIVSVIGSIPSVNTYSSRYQIKCTSNGVLRGNFLGSELNPYETDFYNETAKEYARFACIRQDLKGDELSLAYEEARSNVNQTGYIGVGERVSLEALSGIPTTKNYEILILKKECYSPWWFIAIPFFLGLLLIPLVTLLIRAIFLYVAFKEPLFKSFLQPINRFLAVFR